MDKPVAWMGRSKKELLSMPDDVKDEFGYAIGEAQAGRTAASAKPMSGNLRDVMEIVSNEKGDTFRAMYTTKLAGRVYVLAAFQKKSKSGITTPKADIDRILERLKAAKALHRKDSLSQG